MKATLLLLAPVLLLVSCGANRGQVGDPVAPAISNADLYGVPQAQTPGARPPYQEIGPINPPAAIPAAGTPTIAQVPSIAPAPVSPDLNGNVYVIQKGDSLWGLSRKFGTTVDAIKQLNGLTSDTIVSGRNLIIPGR